jgi:hypothetical protein
VVVKDVSSEVPTAEGLVVPLTNRGNEAQAEKWPPPQGTGHERGEIVMDSYVVSKRLAVHPSDVRSTVEAWHESLRSVSLGRRLRRFGSGLWLAPKPQAASSSDPFELYRVRGFLWLFGRPIRVMLEFSIWSDAASEVTLRPANLSWPVWTDRFGRKAARVLEAVVASVTSDGAVARPRGVTPRFAYGFKPLSGFVATPAVHQHVPSLWPTTPTQGS